MTSQYKVMSCCEFCIYAKIMHYSLLTWRNGRLKHLKYIIHNAQNRRSIEISSRIFETYKNVVQPHGCHIYNTSADMAMAKIFPVPLNIMVYHTGNVCYAVVISSQVLSYPVRRQIKIQQTCVKQYDFVFTVMFHVVLFTRDAHTMNEQHVHFVP